MPHQGDRMACALKIAYPDWSDERAASLISAFELPELPVAPLQIGHSLPSTWDEKDWPEHAAKTMGAARDSDYLNWRYRNHPVFDYQFLTVAEGNRTGLAVWRLETIRTETPHGRKDVDRIGRLVEFLPVSSSNAQALFGAFVGELDRGRRYGRGLLTAITDAPGTGSRKCVFKVQELIPTEHFCRRASSHSTGKAAAF